tara:strand:- start:124 stop:426 length:303 start_codon:yes stop_codon:yes gene_type:complete
MNVDQWGRNIEPTAPGVELSAHSLLLEPRETYDRARAGVVQADGVIVAAYDVGRLQAALIEVENCTPEESAEWVAYNVIDSWAGPHTPVIQVDVSDRVER